jgi:hypothetical protein
MSVPNRLATEGDELVVHRFSTGTIGLTSRSDRQPPADARPLPRRTVWSVLKEIISPPATRAVPAVCIAPGARLLLQDIPEHLQRELAVDPAEEVTFTQLTAAEYSHRDAVRFQNGHEILLQRLSDGQRVRVLSLSSTETVGSVREGRPEVFVQVR